MLPEASCQPCSEHAATDEVDAQAIADLLKCHLWIVSAQMSGFIADDLWSRLPEAWQAPLLALSDEEASRLPTDLPLPPDWPSDLAHLLHSGRAAARCGSSHRIGEPLRLARPYDLVSPSRRYASAQNAVDTS